MPQMDFFTIDEKSSLPLTFWQIPALENTTLIMQKIIFSSLV